MVGELAFSMFGHDAGSVYIIIDEDHQNVYLADGIKRTLKCPKKKNKKHIQRIKKMSDHSVLVRLRQNSPVKDEEISRLIREYNRSKEVSDVKN